MARRCSFCGESEHQVEKLVAGPRKLVAVQRVYICDVCIHKAKAIIDSREAPSPRNAPDDTPG